MRHRKYSASSEGAGDSPGVGLLVAVVQRLQFQLLLLPAEAMRVGHSVERWGELHQPAGVDGGHLPHVLLGRQHQLMVHKPEGSMIRKIQLAFTSFVLL